MTTVPSFPWICSRDRVSPLTVSGSENAGACVPKGNILDGVRAMFFYKHTNIIPAHPLFLKLSSHPHFLFL